ncbi:hypothetical protein K431DRAFT_347300 [Polychaeton citri CBS 116435]|uniref:Rad60/SUMO-like domain-containing protein n=1 Tax=Polychaeton citri CBS 116435 TaxID=1314669 RepID=A0A9P4UPB8_9PEZI|nr:hypothetical protein K431DRAFT_347300 [Polychaeton citri CBS 116435]
MSFFNRPAWAQNSTKDDEDQSDDGGSNLFSHSGNFQNILANRKRREDEQEECRKAKEKREAEQDDSKETVNTGSASHRKDGKRRRINAKESERLLNRAGVCAKPRKRRSSEGQSDRDEEDGRQFEDEVASRSTPDPPSWSHGDGEKEIIDLGSSDDDNAQPIPKQPTAGSDASEEHLPEDGNDDPMFAALARRAREQREAQQLQTIQSQSPPIRPTSTSKGGLPTPPPPNDGVAGILITSQIPGTKPLVVQRKLSQRVQEVRVAWCNKQEFPSGVSIDDVFFAYRLRRVYDSTLVRNLGFEADGEGRVYMVGSAHKQLEVDKIHLEAVTDEILKRLKVERADSGATADNPPQDGGEISQPAPTADESSIRLVLKAKGHTQPFKLKVKPSTQIGRIVQSCRKPFKVQEGQSVHIEFDGEALDESSCIADTEIEDLFTLDVFID